AARGAAVGAGGNARGHGVRDAGRAARRDVRGQSRHGVPHAAAGGRLPCVRSLRGHGHRVGAGHRGRAVPAGHERASRTLALKGARSHMTTTRRDFLRMGVVALGVARVGTAAAQSATPVKVGHVVLGDLGVNVPTLVALEKGFFKQNGVDAEMITFKSGPDLLKGVMSGGADIGITGGTDPLVFRDRGSTIRIVATVTDKNHFTLTALPNVKKLEDLKGGSIGVTAVGANTWVFGRMI